MNKNDLIILLIIFIAVFLSALVGYIMGGLPYQEKYKVYSENRITYIERIQEWI